MLLKNRTWLLDNITYSLLCLVLLLFYQKEIDKTSKVGREIKYTSTSGSP